MKKESSRDISGKVTVIEHAESLRGGVLLYTDDGAVRKLPSPSSDPNDPLNLSPCRQRLIIAAVCFYGITGFGAVQSAPLLFCNLIPEYMKQTHGVSFAPTNVH